MPAQTKRQVAAKNSWNGKRRRSRGKSSHRRPKRLKKWSDESMKGAMEAVNSGEMGTNQAAREFGVPATTLKDRLSGRVKHGSKPGPAPYLTEEEERELAEFLISVAQFGYGKTKHEVFNIVRKTLEKKGKDTSKFNGEGWWNRFTDRHPELSLRTADPLSMSRANSLSQATIDAYYNLLEMTLKENQLLDKSAQIYNMDESGMPLCHKQPKCIAERGARKVHGRASGDKSQITIVACANAAGYTLPPMVIFKGERLNADYTKNQVPNTLYGMSKQGWIDSGLFYLWFREQFLTNIPPTRPVLLLLDGHSTHYTPEALREARKEGVIIMCLPPNTTHAAQPLDVSFFGPLKKNWSSVCHSYVSENPGKVVIKYSFSGLFSQAWYKTIRPELIVAGFRTVGICPFDRTAIKAVSLDECRAGVDPAANEEDPPNEGFDEHEDDSPVVEQIGVDTRPFTEFEEELFQTRYENGYDLFIDPNYVSWLQLHHPESIPEHMHVSAPSNDETMELEEYLHAVQGMDAEYPPNISSTAATIVATSPGTSTMATSPIAATIVATPHCASTRITTPATAATGVATPTSTKRSGTQRKALTPITSFLNMPPMRKNARGDKFSAARVLTSEQCLAMIEEKERKKREEEEAKERRKAEREEKRRVREAEKLRKIEERQRKTQEREQQKQLKQQKRQKRPRKSTNKVGEGSKSSCGLQREEISSDECAVCLGAYQDDFSENGELMREWLQCTRDSCAKWMHQDCLEEDDGVYVCVVCGNLFC